MAEYENPFHDPSNLYSEGAIIRTSAKPKKYRGYLIYHRVINVWDVVKDGVCVSMLAGPNGARRKIDEMIKEKAHG